MPYLFDPNEGRVLTVPNVLTVLRLCLLPPIYLFLRRGSAHGDAVSAALMVLGGATDFFDGLLARRLRQTSNLGRILDPLADKVYAISILLMLVALRRVPSWYLAAVVARDALIVLGGAYLVLGKRFVSESNWLGKFTAASVVAVIVAHTLRLGIVAAFLLALSALLLLASAVSYGLVFARLARTVPSSGQEGTGAEQTVGGRR